MLRFSQPREHVADDVCGTGDVLQTLLRRQMSIKFSTVCEILSSLGTPFLFVFVPNLLNDFADLCAMIVLSFAICERVAQHAANRLKVFFLLHFLFQNCAMRFSGQFLAQIAIPSIWQQSPNDPLGSLEPTPKHVVPAP